MKILIGGGCKQGKSTLAQQLCLLQGGPPVYVATMRPTDAEDDARIARHRAERAGLGFRTVECPDGIGRLPGLLPPDASLLVDSTTALLAEMMFPPGRAWDPGAADRARADLLRLLDAYGRIVLVTDTIDMDGVRYGEATEAYRRGLASLDRFLAARCDAVIEIALGIPILHKGSESVAASISQAAAGIGDGAGPVHGAARPHRMG